MLGENRRPPATFRLRRTADTTAHSGPSHRGGRMPVTARLSKRFYDVFGEEIATELVDWFNQVDDTYRTDLRELNEVNFTRFDAKLEQRLAESDARWERRRSDQPPAATVEGAGSREPGAGRSQALLLPAPRSLLPGGGKGGGEGS